MLKNYMEIVVEELLPSVLQEHKLKCDCDRCIEDIKAITLNALEPKYVVSEKGVLYTKLNEFSSQFKADVVRSMMVAIGKVEERPSH